MQKCTLLCRVNRGARPQAARKHKTYASHSSAEFMPQARAPAAHLREVKSASFADNLWARHSSDGRFWHHGLRHIDPDEGRRGKDVTIYWRAHEVEHDDACRARGHKCSTQRRDAHAGCS